MHLKDPEAAKIVEDAILFGTGERYDLFAWCVMSNHVHVLLMPKYQEVEEPESRLRRAGKPDLLSCRRDIYRAVSRLDVPCLNKIETLSR